MILNVIFGTLAGLSILLLLWQWLAARRFPLHRRNPASAAAPGVTVLKPVKGLDAHTAAALRSWFAQDYAGEVQILFAIADANDPAAPVIQKLIQQFPQRDARLVLCAGRCGANAKVSKLAQLEPLVKHDLVVISDADVKVPPDLLVNLLGQLRDSQAGLVNCFYQLANPTTLAMQLEAIAVNADFWSQVLQSQSLKPLDFALGAVMATRRSWLAEIGGFRALADCLADDYQLGHRLAQRGHRIELCPVVVECWSSPMGWGAVWRHQVRWARTIRVCQPAPYFFSLLSNATLWPLLWLAVEPSTLSAVVAAGAAVARVLVTLDCQARLIREWRPAAWGWLAPVKDMFQVVIWAAAFAGNRIEWRGERYRLRRDGSLVRD